MIKLILFSRYQCQQRIRGNLYKEMRYISLGFTYYLLAGLLTQLVTLLCSVFFNFIQLH